MTCTCASPDRNPELEPARQCKFFPLTPKKQFQNHNNCVILQLRNHGNDGFWLYQIPYLTWTVVRRVVGGVIPFLRRSWAFL